MEKRYKPTFTVAADFGVWAQTHPVLLDGGYNWVPSYSLNDSLHAYFDVTDEAISEIQNWIADNLYYFDIEPSKDFYIIDDSPSSVTFGNRTHTNGYVAKMKYKYGGRILR